MTIEKKTQVPQLTEKTVRRGRPKKQADQQDTREALLSAGVVEFTQKGFGRSGIDAILKTIGVPKGSFYHYFSSKEAFGLAILARYRQYFEHKLDRFLLDESLPPLQRLQAFGLEAQAGMARYDFQRGCLVGNLEQESCQLSAEFQQQLVLTYESWQQRIAHCLQLAQKQGELVSSADIDELAKMFWIGWEGSVHRSRLLNSTQPMESYMAFFINAIRV